MTLRKIKLLIIASIAIASAMLQPNVAYSQYYTWGSDVPTLTWRDIKTPDVRVIYPDTVSAIARRTLHYINSVWDYVDFGYTYPALKRIPVVMHAENFSSNALVMWMPKRIDFLTTPSVESYSMPWIKQLVAHEYRHAVQYNNLNRGVVRVLSYILGEQGASLGLLFLPISIIEGDAVKCETSMSSFGRGLQPIFSMGYRAIGREDMLTRKNIDRWFCGSYLEYTPDHYRLGYQIVDYSYTRFKENIWNRVAEFGVRRPYYIATVSTALKKFYGVDNAQLMRATFNDLFDYWESLPERENSTEIVMPIDTTNYTTYSHPMPYRNESIVALKDDYNDPDRFVKVDPESREEQRIAYVGSVSTRPSIGDERVWWSEYRQSKLFMQRVFSQLCYMDIEQKRPRTVRRMGDVLYPTAQGQDDRVAYVEYTPNGQYSVVELRATSEKVRSERDFEEVSRTKIGYLTEVHGLAWDDVTDGLYFLATDDSGMWLGRVNPEEELGYTQLRKGAYISLSDLRAEGGKLYFGSIESGYDEIHSFDIATGVERRLSQSTYGSFDPSTPIGEYNYATTYDKYGYHLARQRIDKVNVEVEPTKLPQNIVNPKRDKWDLINLDTVRYTTIDSLASHREHKARRYNKGIKLLNVHSWMPIEFNPFEFSQEQLLSMSFGATVMSQNLLSSAEAYASYGYNTTEGSLFSGGVVYRGLGVEIEVDATYGGNQIVYNPFDSSLSSQQKYYSITTGLTLPLYYQRGYHSRQLSFSSYWNYSNGLVFDLDKLEFSEDKKEITNYGVIGYNEGLHKMSFGIGYYDLVRGSKRDVATPWGYVISANYAMSPSERNFSDLLGVYAKIYTPGLFAHNSFTIAASYQTSIGGYKIDDINLLSFHSVVLLPRGFSSSDVINRDYASMSLNYQFPVWYPEGGIGSILYIRRMRVNLGLDGARFNDYEDNVQQIYSYGGDLIFDINPLRMPEASTTAVQISVYKPSFGSIYFSAGVSLPF